MLWFWGTVAVVLALTIVAAWFYDRRNNRSGMSDRERASVELSRNEPYRYRDSYGGGGGIDGPAF